ncbi:MAG: Rieske (2Fe-2S) protein [Deltaproteobacteria bacterium]|nr:Rieske (2Fe-2S) protein [Deltaproteobacteria bacterium]
MAEFVHALKLTELPPGSAKTVEIGAAKIALYNVGGQIHATADTCLHRGASLGDEGSLDGKLVVCGWHGWEYDVTNGECTMNRSKKLACFETKIDGDAIWVKV